jgi:hypothetical protein
MQIGDLVLDKELDELGVVIEVRKELYVVRSLVTGEPYPVPVCWCDEELELI